MKNNNNFITDEGIKRRILLSSLSNSIADITIMPTEKCNFRCVYCYEDFEISNMKPNKINAVKKFIKNKIQEVKILKINWFGGEPFLAKNIIYDISEYAKNKCNKHEIKFMFSATTNGALLDKETWLTMYEFGIRSYQITLDGDELVHNTTRVDAKGNGTFSKIWDNLLIANELFKQGLLVDTKITLRLHLHSDNLTSLNGLCDKILDNLNNQLFQFFIKEIGNYGRKKNELSLLKSNDNADLIKHQIYGKVSNFSNALENNDLPSICYASKANAYVIRANGRLAKCTVALNSSENDIGEIDDEGNLIIDNDKAVKWLHGLSTMSKKDIACPLSGVFKIS